jgi:hypothetical protein
MAHYFNYDKNENKHQIFGVQVKNEKDEIVGYRPVVNKSPKGGGTMDEISDQYPQIKWKIFSTEKLARDCAIEFFNNL